MSDKVSVLIPEEKVQERVAELGAQISRDYEGKTITMICVLKGGVVFMCDLAKKITVPGFPSVSSACLRPTAPMSAPTPSRL